MGLSVNLIRPFGSPCRCSSGFDRYRQEWLAYGCAQEVRGLSEPDVGKGKAASLPLTW